MMDRGTSRLVLWGRFSGYGLGVALVAFILDRLFKLWMLGPFDLPSRGRYIVTPFFDLVMVWNKGVSYGLFQAHSGLGRLVLIVFAVVVTAGLVLWLAQVARKLVAVAIGLVIGGAIGNVYDRVHYGAVADFFSFHALGFYWYIFNVADIWIVLGVVFFLYDSLFPAKPE
ncbi:MAG: signal peptidase II [Parvibaculaceae bacterium]|nr:signal peptidase II [Parvibaculaceae bacterium]